MLGQYVASLPLKAGFADFMFLRYDTVGIVIGTY